MYKFSLSFSKITQEIFKIEKFTGEKCRDKIFTVIFKNYTVNFQKRKVHLGKNVETKFLLSFSKITQ